MEKAQKSSKECTGALQSRIYKETSRELASKINVASQIMAQQMVASADKEPQKIKYHPIVVAFPTLDPTIRLVGSNFKTASGLRQWAQRNELNLPMEVIFELLQGHVDLDLESQSTAATSEDDASTSQKTDGEAGTSQSGVKPKVQGRAEGKPTTSQESFKSASSELQEEISAQVQHEVEDDGNVAAGIQQADETTDPREVAEAIGIELSEEEYVNCLSVNIID